LWYKIPDAVVLQVCWNAVTSTTIDKQSTLQRFGTSADGDGATFVEIRAIHAKDISPLSMVKSENELVLSPNTMFKVVACYTSEHLKNLRGVQRVYAAETYFSTQTATGLLNIPEKVDMIVLQEIDHSDCDQVLPDAQLPYIRRHKAISAAGSVSTPAIISEPLQVDSTQTAILSSVHDSVNSSETDSAVSISELAPGVPDSVDLQEGTAPENVELIFSAHSVEVADSIVDVSAQVCL
jgi:hypothetical protein